MTLRFSIRTALVALTLGAGFSLILAQAVRGEEWAIGVVIAVVALPAALLPCAAWTLVIRGISALLVDKTAEPAPAAASSPETTA